MQFTYHIDSGAKTLQIENDLYRYLFKVRRHKIDKDLYFRNFKDNLLYRYKIINISKKNALLELVDTQIKDIIPSKLLHLGWCIIDIKSIEKVLPALNEIGVGKITFIGCQYSQQNIKINYQKLQKILINSSSQCGRSDMMILDQVKDLQTFIENYPQSYMFNFAPNNHINNHKNQITDIVVGCEGGFTDDEIALFAPDKIVGINSPMILRSQTAVEVVSSLLLV